MSCIYPINPELKLSKVIANVSSNDQSRMVKILAKIKTNEFFNYAKTKGINSTLSVEQVLKVTNDEFLKSFDNNDKDLLTDVINKYIEKNSFNVRRTTTIKQNSNYAFRDGNAYDFSKVHLADLLFIDWYNRPETNKTSDNFKRKSLGRVFINLTKEFNKRLVENHKDKLNNIIGEELPKNNAELLKYLNNYSVKYVIDTDENGKAKKEQRVDKDKLNKLINNFINSDDYVIRNYCDLFNTLLSQPLDNDENFSVTDYIKEVFDMSKISSLFSEKNIFGEEEELLDTIVLEDDEVLDIDDLDQTVNTTDQWLIDNMKTDSKKFATADTKLIFEKLPKLSSYENNTAKRDNPFNAIEFHNYAECHNQVLFALNELDGQASIADFIKALRLIAKNNPNFIAFARLADTLEKSDDICYKIMNDLNNPVANYVRLTLDSEGKLDLSQSNFKNNDTTTLLFNMFNDIKYTHTIHDNYSNGEELSSALRLLDKYINAYNKNNNEAIKKEVDDIISKIENIFKLYFPNFYIDSLHTFLVADLNDDNNFGKNTKFVLSYLTTIVKSAATAADASRIKYEASRKIAKNNRAIENKENKIKSYEISLNSTILADFVKKDLAKQIDEIKESIEPLMKEIQIAQNELDSIKDTVDTFYTNTYFNIQTLVNRLKTYIDVKAEYNTRNVNDKQQSSITYNNYIYSLAKTFRYNPQSFLTGHFKSNQFRYSNLIRNAGSKKLAYFERTADGNYILATKDGVPLISKMYQPFLIDGIKDEVTGKGYDWSNISDQDLFGLKLKMYVTPIGGYRQYTDNGDAPNYGTDMAAYILPTPSDAPKNFALTLFKYDNDGAKTAVKNIIMQQLLDYVVAYQTVMKAKSKDDLIYEYHFNTKSKESYKKLTGNVFKLNKLVEVNGYNSAEKLLEVINNYISLTGNEENKITLSDYKNAYNAEFIYPNPDGKATFQTEFFDTIEAIAEEWLSNFEKDAQYELDKFSDVLLSLKIDRGVAAAFMRDEYINGFIIDELLRGDSSFYNNFKTIVKRDKQHTAGGKQYPTVDFRNMATYNGVSVDNYVPADGLNHSQELTEIIDNTTKETATVFDKDGTTPVKLRTGFSAITIKNSIKKSKNAQHIYEKLKAAGETEEFAQEIALRYGDIKPTDKDGKYIKGKDGKDLVREGEVTKVNDAQSYITIWEAARRIKLRGDFKKYGKLLQQLTDTTTPVKDIDKVQLKSFIQVLKHFYFDHYYEPKFGREVSRQIKNAEFVLIPKFVGHYENGKFVSDCSLGDLLQIMMNNNIDQVNTLETSKATNYDVLTFWDNDGNVTKNQLNNFNDKLKDKSLIKSYSYQYLYTQQEVPQHILDAVNKAGIQILKKVFDNLPNNEFGKEVKQAIMNAYVANIEESSEELIDRFNIKVDENGKINEIDPSSFKEILKFALKEAQRLGQDSNIVDFFTQAEDGNTVMPMYLNISASKIESIANSMFNRAITRQTLPGVHAAQISGIGFDRKIVEFRKENGGITEFSKVSQYLQIDRLNYHAEDNVVEILLPAWAKELFNSDGNTININDIDKDVLEMIGYRIPTEGKQSTAVMRVVGFLPTYFGSTVVVPDEWVTQTGSDFDVDSIYFIVKEIYKDKNGKVHAIKYNDGVEEKDYENRYIRYIKEHLDAKERKELTSYSTLGAEEKSRIASTLQGKTDKERAEEYSKAEHEKAFSRVKEYADLKGFVDYKTFKTWNIAKQNSRAARNNHIVNNMIKILNSKYAIAETLAQSEFSDIAKAIGYVDDIKKKYGEVSTENTSDAVIGYDSKYNRNSVERNQSVLYVFTDNTDRTSSLPEDPRAIKYPEDSDYNLRYGSPNGTYGTNSNPTTAVIRGLDNAFAITTMKYFYKLHGMKKSDEARWTNKDIDEFKKVIDKDFEYLKAAWDSGRYRKVVFPGDEENKDGLFNGKISKLNASDATEIKKYLKTKYDEFISYVEANKVQDIIPRKESIYHTLDQLRAHRNATSGLHLKGLSVMLDSFCSVASVSRAEMREGIYVDYGNDFDLTTGRLGWSNNHVGDSNVLYHDTIGWNKNNNKAVNGLFITAASSHTTAHILDAVKEGSVENENVFTFQAFKLLFNLGVDAETAVLWLRQQGITELVDAWYSTNSVLYSNPTAPANIAIKNIARKLGILINGEPVSQYTKFNDVINALQANYGKRFEEIFPNSTISTDFRANKISSLVVPGVNIISRKLMLERYTSTETLQKDKNSTLKNDIDRLLFDLGMVINFLKIDAKARKVMRYAKVLNTDKFGASQKVFDTKKYLKNIAKIITDETNKNGVVVPFLTSRTTEQVLDDDEGLLEAIYPGIQYSITGNTIDYDTFFKYNNNEESVYPYMNAFLRNATMNSIRINSQLIDTESPQFDNIVDELGKKLGREITTQEQDLFKKYIVGTLYPDVLILTEPIKLDADDNIVTAENYIDDRGFIDNKKHKEILRNEERRIYGYGKYAEKQITISDVSHPTQEDIDNFSKLSPAQKINFINNHKSVFGSTQDIFDFIETELVNDYVIYKKGDCFQRVKFIDQDRNREPYYRLFKEAFFNSNPLIRLAAIDLVKYAFVVEGFNFRRGAVSKILANDALTLDIKNNGTGIISEIKPAMTSIIEEGVSDEIYENFIRGNWDKLNLPVYKVTGRENDPFVRFGGFNRNDVIAQNNVVYKYDANSDNIYKLANTGIISINETEGLKIITKKHNYVVLSRNVAKYVGYKKTKYETVKELYKVVSSDLGVAGTHFYLVPLSNLNPNENSSLSIDDTNNTLTDGQNMLSPTVWKEYCSGVLNKDNTFIVNGVNLFDPAVLGVHVTQKIEASKNTEVNETLINDLREIGSVDKFVKDINKYFENTNYKFGVFYLQEKEIKKYFPAKDIKKYKNMESPSIIMIPQTFVDEKGISHNYKIARIAIAPNNATFKRYIGETINIPTSLVDNQVNDNLYLVLMNNNPVKVGKDTGEPKFSIAYSDDLSVDDEAELAKNMLKDVQHRVDFAYDEENRQIADRIVLNIKRSGIDVESQASIAAQKYSVISNLTNYYLSVADKIIRALDNYDNNGNDVLNEGIVNLIKNDDVEAYRYIKFYLDAITFGNSFDIITTINLDNFAPDIRRNVERLKTIISRVKNNDKLTNMRNIIINEFYAKYSNNPMIKEHLFKLGELLYSDENKFDKYFQNPEEIANPLIQVIFKLVRGRSNGKKLEGNKHISDVIREIDDIKNEASAAGQTVNQSKFVDANGRFKTGISDKWFDDLEKLNDDALVANMVYGKYSREYQLAQNRLNLWMKDNAEQKYVKEYYDELSDILQPMLSPEFIDHYIEYLRISDERRQAINDYRNTHSPEDFERMNELSKQLKELTTPTYEDYSWKPDKEKYIALQNYVNEYRSIKRKYFDEDTRIGFEEDLEYYLNIIAKKRRYDALGNQKRSEYDLADDEEYISAVTWLAENTIHNVPPTLQKEVQQAFDVLRKNGVFASGINSRFIGHRDANGVIDGTTFTDDEIAEIKHLQELEYGKADNNLSTSKTKSLVRIIRSKPTNNHIYKEDFYHKIVGGTPVSEGTTETLNELAKQINEILYKCYDSVDKKIYLSRLEDVNDLRKLKSLYFKYHKERFGARFEEDRTRTRFLEQRCTFDTDTAQHDLDASLARAKGDDFFNAFVQLANQTINYSKFGIDWTDGINSDIYGFIKPKDEYEDEYIDKKKEKALKFLNENIQFVTTKYFEEAARKAQAEGKLEEFMEKNTVFNPYTNEYEVLRIWQTMEYKGQAASSLAYMPSWSNLIQIPKEETINTKYGKNKPNWRTDTGYGENNNLNSYEQRILDIMLREYFDITKNNPTAYNFTRKAKFPRQRISANDFKNNAKRLATAIGLGYNAQEDRSSVAQVGYEYDRFNNLPMLDYLRGKGYKILKTLPEREENESDAAYEARLRQTIEENKEIKELNNKAEQAILNHDYLAVFENFLKHAVIVNANEGDKLDLYFGLNYLKNYAQAITTNSFGGIKKDRISSLKDFSVANTKSPENAILMFETFIKRYLFDEFKEKNYWDGFFASLQNFSSAKFMMLNLAGGISNVITGKYNIAQEYMAKEYFGYHTWLKAQNMYTKYLVARARNHDKIGSDDLIDAFIKAMNIVDFDSIIKATTNAEFKEYADKLRNSLYILNSEGENYLQNTAMIALMLDTRIWQSDGKWVIGNISDYEGDITYKAMDVFLERHPEYKDDFEAFKKAQFNNITDRKEYQWFNKNINTEFIRKIATNSEEEKQYAFEFSKIMDELDDNIRESFDNEIKLIDQLELDRPDNGILSIKADSPLTYEMLGQFRHQAISINQKINGVYDKIGAGGIESMYPWGSLVMQYHKHIYTNAMKRYRKKGYFNETRGTIERGYLQDLWAFASADFSDFRAKVKNRSENDEFEFFNCLQQVVRSFIDTCLHIQMNWALMTPTQKRNMKRLLASFATLFAGLNVGFASSVALAAMGEDDDKNKASKFLANLALYEADDIITQIEGWSIGLPGESKKLWGNPIAIGTTIQDLTKVVGFTVQMLVYGDEFDPIYNNGIYKDQNKFVVALLKNIPVYSRINRVLNLDKNNSYYKLQQNIMGFIPMDDYAQFVWEQIK